ncbi:MAG TPA: polyketide synthase dehydratase domain-containing protein, partial [Verrucomicrobiae bacterium]|nr:polyketide synthase dehydratase domain-containing protein [Verrucomicrobiae bacterium]
MPVNYAFHSPQMAPFRKELVSALATLSPGSAVTPLYSTVTGRLAALGDYDSSYWGRNVCETVRFAAAIEAMLDDGINAFIELSPQPVLLSMVAQCAGSTSDEVSLLPSLRKGEPERRTLLNSLAKLFSLGAEINWSNVCPSAVPAVALPLYPWQRKRYWVGTDSSAVTNRDQGKPSRAGYPGRRIHSPGIAGHAFESELAFNTPSFLQDHRIFGGVIVPAPLFIEMALFAHAKAYKTNALSVRDLSLHRSLPLSDEAVTKTVHTVLSPPERDRVGFEIHSAETSAEQEPVWTLHATGKIVLNGSTEQVEPEDGRIFDAPAIEARLVQEHSSTEFYRLFEQKGVDFGPAYRIVKQIRYGTHEALARLQGPGETTPHQHAYRIHPVLLDAALQAIAAVHVLNASHDVSAAGTWLFCGLEELRIVGAASGDVFCHAVVDRQGEGSPTTLSGEARLFDAEGKLVAEIKGARFRRASQEILRNSKDSNPANLLFEVAWRPYAALNHQLRSRNSNYLPAVADLAGSLERRATQAAAKFSEAPGANVAALFDRLGAAYVAKALQNLAWKPARGDRFSADELARKLKVLPQHGRLFARMLGMLGEENVLRDHHGSWEVGSALPSGMTDSFVQELTNRHPEFRAELALFDRCASRLADVITGAVNPLQLLFPEGSLASAAQVYQDSTMSRLPNALVAEVVKQAVSSLPPGRV